MLGFIRPEAKAQLMKWREVLAGGAALALGLYWVFVKSSLFLLPGIGAAVAGAALIWIGVQRARFRGEGQGPGSVQVDEGQITYFGPLTGGAVALADLDSIIYDPQLYPAHWRLRQPGVSELLIPVNADGAEALFDAFASLPGLRMEALLSARKASQEHPIVIWRRGLSGAAQLGLH